MSHPPRAMWLELATAGSEAPQNIGNKAARLAELSQAGFLVPDGWVLPADRVDAGTAANAAAALVRLRPGTTAWILRSSSPLEDRPGASAAGLFRSEISGPSAHEIGEAIRSVAGSRRLPHVEALVGEEPPLAILAQPLLELEAWYTAELRPGRSAELEGWPGEIHPPEDLLASVRALDPDAPYLLELGRAGGEWYVLQLRPAPAAALPTAVATSVAPVQVDQQLWRWDREHAARPLCPLLAGYFERWLAMQADPPSRLFHGCWYDRRDRSASGWDEEAMRKLCNLAPLEEMLRGIEQAARESDWSGAEWRRFMGLWLRFQEEYFARPTGAAREWLLDRSEDAAARGRSFTKRELALDELSRADTTQLSEFLASHGHHSGWPWDGRGRTWAEDPEALRRELRRRASPSRTHGETHRDARVAAVAQALEEDDELLSRSYALFRIAVRSAATSLGIDDEHWEDALEIGPAEWESLLDDFDAARWDAAVQTGRTLGQRWLGQALLLATKSAANLRGTPIVGGRVHAPVTVLPSAGAGGGPRAGEILVTPSIQPADAIYFGRIAGLIVESGDRLSHAAVLAREAGVPCVVAVTGACALLASADRVTLDATTGLIEPEES